MKPTITNCHECHLEGRETAAMWATAEGDFYCDRCLVGSGLRVDQVMTIHDWKAKRGIVDLDVERVKASHERNHQLNKEAHREKKRASVPAVAPAAGSAALPNTHTPMAADVAKEFSNATEEAPEEKEPMSKTCKCGCGNPVRSNSADGFIPAHRNRERAPKGAAAAKSEPPKPPKAVPEKAPRVATSPLGPNAGCNCQACEQGLVQQAALDEGAIMLCFTEAQLDRMWTKLPLEEKVSAFQCYLDTAEA